MKKICIGIVTRNRPLMLRDALLSFSKMRRPEQFEFSFVVIENNRTLTIGSVVEAVLAETGLAPVSVDLETRLGIPFARNAVLDEALRQKADFLTFIDDDEVVDENWLVNILLHMTRGEYDLVGGPVLLRTCPLNASPWQRWIWRGHHRRSLMFCNKLAHRAKTKGDNAVNVTTANWIARLDFLRRTGLRFDESIGVGSGSDRRFYKSAVDLGARCSWVETAPVYDALPLERLSLGYTFRRGREHTAFLYFDGRDGTGKTELFSKACMRMARAIFYFLSVPFIGSIGLINAARLAGDMAGFIDAVRGVYRAHYSEVTGN